MKSLTFTCTAFSLCALFSTVALSADIEATTSISQVAVSQGSAEVTRSGQVTLPAGQHNLIITGLPGQLDLSRLSLSLGDEDIRLGNIRVQRQDQASLVGESQQQLQDQLEELLYQRGRIDDTIQSANMQIQLLESLSNGNLGSQEASFSASNIGELLGVVSSSSDEARKTVRDATRNAGRLDIEIEQVRRRLAEFSSRNRFSQTAIAAVNLPDQRQVDFTLTYPVNGAGWTWLYEARLDTDSSFLQLQRQVAVNQTSGENWDNVELTITTARPSSQIAPPDMNSLLVSLEPERFRPENRRLVTGSLTASAVIESAEAADFMKVSANVDASAYLVNYEIPGRVTVTSGGTQQVFPIDERGIEVDLVLRSMPEQDQAVYLEARFLLEDSVPVQPGNMQFYRDGSYIGSQYITSLLPQEEVSLPFGQDERVRVEVLPDEESSDAGGTFRRTAVDNRRQRFLITSFHDTPKTIEVIARLPVSQNEDIDIVLEEDATPPDEVDPDDKAGLLLWRETASSAQPVEIRHYYSIRYPRDSELFFRE